MKRKTISLRDKDSQSITRRYTTQVARLRRRLQVDSDFTPIYRPEMKPSVERAHPRVPSDAMQTLVVRSKL